MTHGLVRGSTLPLPLVSVRALLRWLPDGAHGSGAVDLDVSALLLGPEGRVRSEADFVFYNQPRHPTGLVRHLPKQRDASGLTDGIEADLARLDPGVTRLVLAASAERGFRAGDSRPRLLLHEVTGGRADGPAVAELPLTPEPEETAVLCGEMVRTASAWEFRALTHGCAGGLVALAAGFGITADGSAPRPPSSPPPGPQPGPQQLPPDPRRRPSYGYPQPDPAFTLPPQGPQFLPPGQRA